MYTDILCHLRDAVSRKCPEIWKSNVWFLGHDNAPAHRSVSVNDFLAKNKATKPKYPPYSSDRLQLIFTRSLDSISSEGTVLL